MADPSPYVSEDPLAGVMQDPSYAQQRSAYVDELSDPNVTSKLYSLVHREVGTQGPEAQQAFLETVFNRATARGKTLDQTISDGSYYPRISLQSATLSNDQILTFHQLTNNALDGSNITNGATGNASGRVGFAGGPMTATFGGEKFGIEGPDLKRLPVTRINVQAEQAYLSMDPSAGIVEQPKQAATQAPQAPQHQAGDVEPGTGKIWDPKINAFRFWDQPPGTSFQEKVGEVIQGKRSPTDLVAPAMTGVERAAGPMFSALTGVGEPIREDPLFPSLQMPIETREPQNAGQFATKVGYNIIAGLANFVNTPSGAATVWATGGLPAATRKLVTLGFSAAAVKNTIDRLKEGDWSGAAESAGIAWLTGHGAREEGKVPPVKPVLPPGGPEVQRELPEGSKGFVLQPPITPERQAAAQAAAEAAKAAEPQPVVSQTAEVQRGPNLERGFIMPEQQPPDVMGQRQDLLNQLADFIQQRRRGQEVIEPPAAVEPRISPELGVLPEPDVTAPNVALAPDLGPPVPRDFTRLRRTPPGVEPPPEPGYLSQDPAAAVEVPAEPAIPVTRDPAQAQPEPVPTVSPRAPRTIADIKAENPALSQSEAEAVKTANDYVDRRRAVLGLEARDPTQVRADAVVQARATQVLARDPLAGDKLSNAIVNSRPTGLKLDEQQAVLRGHINNLEEQHSRLVQQINSAGGDPVAEEALNQVRGRMQIAADASARSGTELGRGLRERIVEEAAKYNLTKVISERQAVNGGGPLPLDKLKETEAISERIRGLQDKLLEREAEIATEEAKPTGGFAEGMRAKMAKKPPPGAIPHPAVLFQEAAKTAQDLFDRGMPYAQWAAQMIARHGLAIRDDLPKLWAGVQNIDERKRLGEARGVRNADETTISTRTPTSPNAKEIPGTGANALNIGIDHMLANKDYGTRVADRIRPWMPRELRSRNYQQQILNAVDFFKENKLLLYRLAQEEPSMDLEHAVRQYEGYNIHGHNLGAHYGFSPEAVFGAETVMSSGKSPDASFSMAERLMHILRNAPNERWDARMDAGLRAGTKREIPVPSDILKDIRGKTYNELETYAQKAWWARIYDETHHDQSYRVITPEGTRGDFIRNVDNSRAKLTWTSGDEIAKALKLLENTATPEELITSAKHSSYYNSKRAPGSLRPDYVADRHDVSGGFMMPLSKDPLRPGKAHPLLTDHFSGLKNKMTGDSLYGLQAEAGRQAAAELGLVPSDFQAGFWSYQRAFMSPDALGEKATRQIQKVWEGTYRGKRSIEDARTEVLRIAREALAERRAKGYDPRPAYERRAEQPDRGALAVERATGYQSELSALQRDRGAGGPGDGGAVPGAVTEKGLSEQEQIVKRGYGGRSFRVDTADGRRAFYDGLRKTFEDHPYGKSVEVKDRAFYDDPTLKLFLSPDESAGVAVTKDGELVSGFKHPKSRADINALLAEAAPYATDLEAFASGNGKLPELYARHGFRPVARIAFDPALKPEGWNLRKLDNPDIVKMVRDPENKLGLPDVAARGWNAVKDEVPLVTYDKAKTFAEKVLDKIQARHRVVGGVGGLAGKRAPLTEEERLARYETRAVKRTEELRAKTAAGDVTPLRLARSKLLLDPRRQAIADELARATHDYAVMLEKDRLARRPITRKIIDTAVEAARTVKLMGATIFGKLAGATATRILQTSAEEMIGKALSMTPVMRSVMEAAPTEGTPTLASIKAYPRGFVKGIKSMGDVLRGREQTRDIYEGKEGRVKVPSVLDIPARLHAAEKSPARMGQTEMAFAKALGVAERRSRLNEPGVIEEARALAKESGERAINMQKNVLGSWWNSGIDYLEHNKRSPRTGYALAKMARFFFPIVRFPLNELGENANMNTGLATGGYKLVEVMKRGMQTIEPKEADFIARNFKKGLVGAGLLYLGYANRDNIGGFYQDPREKHKMQRHGIKMMEAQMMGVRVPWWFFGTPAGLQIQLGATIGKLMDAGISRAPAVMEAAGHLVNEIPFLKENLVISQMLMPGYEGERARGRTISGALIPGFVREAAALQDQGKKRAPHTILQYLEQDIPYLRQNVPLAKHQ